MKTFVTGATGFLGSHLVDRLLERGDAVACLVRPTSDLRWLEGKPVELVRGGLEGEPGADLLRALGEAECVYHAAGAIMGIRREDYVRANAGGTGFLCEALMKAGARPRRFLLVSSIAAAGPGWGKEPILEDQHLPVNWYGESKLEAERITLEHGARFPVTIVRPPPVYGPRDTGMLTMFRGIKLGLVLTFRRVTRTNFVFVRDLVRGMILAAESKNTVGEILNVGDRENMGTDEAMRRIAAVLGKKTTSLRLPATLGYLAAGVNEVAMRMRGKPSIFNWQKMAELDETNWAIDIGKIRKLTGYEPETSIEEGGRRTYGWYVEEGWL